MREAPPTDTPAWNLANKQRMSGVLGRMLLDFTICTAMFGNGAAIAGIITTLAHRLTEVLGKLEPVVAECSVVVPGTAMRSIAAVPIAVTTAGRASLGARGVFALRWRRFLPRPSFPGEGSSLFSDLFALFSLDSLQAASHSTICKFERQFHSDAPSKICCDRTDSDLGCVAEKFLDFLGRLKISCYAFKPLIIQVGCVS